MRHATVPAVLLGWIKTLLCKVHPSYCMFVLPIYCTDCLTNQKPGVLELTCDWLAGCLSVSGHTALLTRREGLCNGGNG